MEGPLKPKKVPELQPIHSKQNIANIGNKECYHRKVQTIFENNNSSLRNSILCCQETSSFEAHCKTQHLEALRCSSNGSSNRKPSVIAIRSTLQATAAHRWLSIIAASSSNFKMDAFPFPCGWISTGQPADPTNSIRPVQFIFFSATFVNLTMLISLVIFFWLC